MELHQLKYFVAVAETGSFTRAAERVGVTQPTLSEQILRLESRKHGLNRRLFDRLGRKVVLTEAGQVLLGHAQAILAAVKEAERAVRDAAEGGSLRVGAIPTVAPFLLPELVTRFRKDHPTVQLQLQEDLTERLLANVLAGELDVAMMAMPIRDDRLHVEKLFTEPLVMALPARHRLVAKSEVKLADVVDEPFILLDDIHCFGDQVLSFCHRSGLEPRVVCRGEQIVTLLAMVAAGQGVSVVPEMAALADTAKQCVYRPLGRPVPTRTLCAVWHKQRYRPPSLRALVELAKR
ncbi:MAG: LysR substrate-binding domain-containing protein [Gemmataceae bacterium]|nr:LysR substrate-binding domain-containing protein [Gemmata sp.]MDW8197583.1 LysR substrate-binding domain-containing protein [Gemmataceae bacterium]